MAGGEVVIVRSRAFGKPKNPVSTLATCFEFESHCSLQPAKPPSFGRYSHDTLNLRNQHLSQS